MRGSALGAAILGAASSLGLGAPRFRPAISSVPTIRPHVVAIHPHDPDAFTQGLVFHGGELFESTGNYGRSTVRAVEPRSGRIRTRTFLDPQFFGEGMTILGDRMYVVTWREHTGFIYTLDFLPKGRFTYDGEGWGLTNDGAHLILSDGTTVLRFLDPASFQVVRTLHVHEAGGDVANLNELEMIRGEIWANVWETNRILRISPETGDVLGALDLSALDGGWSEADPNAVLNGIAFDEGRGRVFLTGKRWPKMYEIDAPAPILAGGALTPSGRP